MPITEIVDLTASLVAVPNSKSEREAGAVVREWLENNTSATVESDETGNIFARKGSGAPSLALIGHHDVVSPVQSQVTDNRIVVTDEGDRLFGRGTADMKGALAAMMVAFREADPDIELIFASFVEEEAGGIGAQAAIEDGFEPAYAIVGEGSASYSSNGVLDVGVAHKGRRGSLIQATGTSAHASEPSAGENAIYRAMEAIDLIRSLDMPTETVFGKSIAGSLTVTEIESEDGWNTVPDFCEVTVDERTVPGQTADLERVESISGIEFSVEQNLPPMRCDSSAFATQVLEIAKESQSGTPHRIVKPHATDAGWLANAGTDCLICGPAEPGEAHTANESVSKSLLSTAFECYLGVADNWAGE